MIIGIDASRAATVQRTGTEAYAYHLLQALVPLAIEKGHRLRLYFNQSASPAIPLIDAVESVVIPFPRLWTHLRLALELYRRPPDVFFTPAHVIPFTYLGCSVATVHDLGYHYFPQAHTRSQLVYLHWSTRHNSRRSRRVITDSRVTKTDLARFYAADPAKIKVVYPGVDPGLRPVENVAQLTAVQLKYKITPPYLLYISTLQPRKNLSRLIRAYAASNVPHSLVLAGKIGWRAQSIFDEIAHLPYSVANKVHQVGFVDDVDKAALISGATALLYPSLYEGFGFPILEGQACGTAVLCSNGSSLPEVAGDAALMVDPLNTGALTAALQRITTDALLRQQLVQEGFVNVKRFTWARAAEETLTILEEAFD